MGPLLKYVKWVLSLRCCYFTDSRQSTCGAGFMWLRLEKLRKLIKNSHHTDQGLRCMHCFPLMQFKRGTVTPFSVLGEAIAQALRTQVFVHTSFILNNSCYCLDLEPASLTTSAVCLAWWWLIKDYLSAAAKCDTIYMFTWLGAELRLGGNWVHTIGIGL